MKRIIVAIDGHSSCGKSTMAKSLAAKVGYTYVDTGAMYRAVTLYSIRHGFFTENGIDEESLKKYIEYILFIHGNEHTIKIEKEEKKKKEKVQNQLSILDEIDRNK